MICPKCQNVMRTVDKNGVHIEQCEGCRGIFLDRGELEQIAGAESTYYGSPPRYAGPDGYGDSPRPYRRDYRDSPRQYQGGYGDSPRPYRGHRRRGFLESLFD
ncbi:TFIIB-type zinc ribbon-containing protein [Amycolatopsis alkalitolerans]|uniref:Transcriptional regulator n=1 Tax=Amycolatopsis alkalitolerans TaxID=2547244 RepID=A0A5C4M6F8_9PSEU|nr:zf-TFIIB domain-containing protein [Amycolatopsis alkalitolerans]TNC28521.1 transcriptional regulator [Amycolatopsis alkalitolerans]